MLCPIPRSSVNGENTRLLLMFPLVLRHLSICDLSLPSSSLISYNLPNNIFSGVTYNAQEPLCNFLDELDVHFTLSSLYCTGDSAVTLLASSQSQSTNSPSLTHIQLTRQENDWTLCSHVGSPSLGWLPLLTAAEIAVDCFSDLAFNGDTSFTTFSPLRFPTCPSRKASSLPWIGTVPQSSVLGPLLLFCTPMHYLSWHYYIQDTLFFPPHYIGFILAYQLPLSICSDLLNFSLQEKSSYGNNSLSNVTEKSVIISRSGLLPFFWRHFRGLNYHLHSTLLFLMLVGQTEHVIIEIYRRLWSLYIDRVQKMSSGWIMQIV